MKNIKIKLFVLLLIVISLFVLFKVLDDYAHPKYPLYKISDITSEEQKLIKEFYNGQEISRGKLFDIKYIEFNSIDDSGIQFIKKTKKKIPDLLITVYDRKTGESIGWTNMPVNYDTFMAAPYEKNGKLFYYLATNMLWPFKSRTDYSDKSLEKDRDLSKLKLVITYKNGEETHYVDALVTPENK
ncbi:hypothetical protein [Amedibacillus sp. YH-ame10]